MEFIREKYGRRYAPDTRETFRRQVLHQFVQGGIAGYNPDNPDLPTDSPLAHYAVTTDALAAVRAFGTRRWNAALARFGRRRRPLMEIYGRARGMRQVPVRLPDGREVRLSPGRHNAVQRAVVEQFAPRFAPGASLLYMGDTSDKR